jgi:hypothetical protein
MTGGNLIRMGGSGDTDRLPGFDMYRLSTIENRLLADGLRQFQVFTDGQFPPDVGRQSLLAQIVAEKLLVHAAPGLGRLIEKARDDLVDCIYVTNLPTDRSITSLLLLTLSSAIGKVFNYGSQDGGELGMEVASSQDRTAGQRAELDWHTEGASIRRDCRAEWICLLGIDNTAGIYTAYAPIKPVEQMLSSRTRAWLFSQSACFRTPYASASEENPWSAPRAVLSRSPHGYTEIVWPSFAVRAARSDDALSTDALIELAAEINRQQLRVSVDTGSFLAFNNLRGVHMHGPTGDGYRLFLKTYVRHSLRTLQQVTGESGPLFALMEVGASQQNPAEGRHLLRGASNDMGSAMTRSSRRTSTEAQGAVWTVSSMGHRYAESG